MSRSRIPREDPAGQILVIVAVGMFAFIGIVALVIDGGHAWGQQRDAQNGIDAVSIAGAVALGQNRPAIYAGDPVPNSDAEIAALLTAMAANNSVILDDAFYTDFGGNRLPGPIEVGSLGDVPPPGAALGVEANGHKDFETFLAGAIGFSELTTDTTATARTGPLLSPGGPVLPVTFPITITGCDGTNKPVTDPEGDRWELNVPYVVPLCQGSPGNVGWLDWTPTAGGMSEVIDSIGPPASGPPTPLVIPEWHYITSTGNQSTAGLEEALNQYAVPPVPEESSPPGTVVLIPLFDDDCADAEDLGPEDPCTAGDGHGAGNMWYHLADWAAFEIDWVDLNGGSSACSLDTILPGATGNGATGCFRGWFRQYMGPGVLGAPDGSETEFTQWGTELIR